jgi:hypothetical protein
VARCRRDNAASLRGGSRGSIAFAQYRSLTHPQFRRWLAQRPSSLQKIADFVEGNMESTKSLVSQQEKSCIFILSQQTLIHQ